VAEPWECIVFSVEVDASAASSICRLERGGKVVCSSLDLVALRLKERRDMLLGLEFFKGDFGLLMDLV
jgi:hypothetical protein